MKKIYVMLVVSVMALLGARGGVQAQVQYQLPDPSFEDWTGTPFNGAIQPLYWNYSNVSQLGIANFNFAQQAEGRTGGLAMKVQDMALTVAGIGETSPGYISLGHPWAHVSSLTAINKATAGTYGGISWTTRPDTLAVWVKRTGPRTADENYNILFYSWVGTSEGGSFKGKDGSCSTVPATYIYDEESDIRLALDGNECVTVTPGVQVAEGWIYEKTEYPNWTRIKVPIYYLNNQVPEKCNVIFSASNYPNFRANSGLYEGNTLIVDDVELIYSSAIQKLYIGGKEWKGFDPNNTGVQTYSLGRGVTTIPTIEARRGVGRLTNNKGNSANFQGRALSATECVINTTGAAVDGAPVTLTVTAEDGSSTTTYQVQFVSQQSNNAYLASIEVDGEALAGFNAYVSTYNVSLPYGTTTVPVVTAEAQDGATVTITQATSPSGTATIQTVAQDGVTTQTYMIHFSVAQLSDNTLQDILIDGVSIPGFVSTKTSYSVSLPVGTTTAPVVTPVSAYPAGAQTITVVKNNLTDGCQITVSAPGATVTRTYRLTYKIEASSYAYLSGIALDGVALDGFDPATTTYTITLPMGTTAMPAISWTQGDAYQTVQLITGGLDGTTRIVVTAAAGNTQTYRLHIEVEKSSNSRLAGISLDGEGLDGFDSDITDYEVALPAGTKELPQITWVTGDEYQTVRMVNAGIDNPVRLIVTAGDGTVSTYVLTFVVQKSANALLQGISLDGVALEGFDPEVFDYRYLLTGVVAPRISVQKSEGQTIVITQPQGVGVARITVQPEEGAPNIYTITFYDESEVVLPTPVSPEYVRSSNADLALIVVGGDTLESFDPEVAEYTLVLPLGTPEQPVLTATPADGKVLYLIYTQGEPNADATIRVVAEDSVTTRDYVIHFLMEKSSNTALEDIDAGGFMTYVAGEKSYTFDVPFGTPFPEVYVAKGDSTQAVDMSYVDAPMRRDVEIVVTAANGDTAVYALHMVVPSFPANVLRSVMGEGWVLDSLALNGSDTAWVTLPYEVDTFAITDIIKNYSSQYIVIRDGGMQSASTIWVYGLGADEPVKTYTLMPRRTNPYRLTDLTVDGVTVAGFSPDRYDYLVTLSDNTVPTVAATAAEGATVNELYNDTKHYQVSVEYADTALYTYTVWYYYLNDTVPNTDFTEWETATYNDGAKPVGWTVPADVLNSYRSIIGGRYTSGGEVQQYQLADTARLNCVYSSGSIGGTMPGMMTLGTMTINASMANGTSSSCTGGIPFHNSPDYFAVRYRPVANTRISQSHFVVAFNEGTVNEFNGSYAVKNEWLIDTLALTNRVTEPTMLNIVLNAGNSENASALGGSFLTQASSTMDVDWISLWYDSELKGIVYEGDTILPDADKHFELTLPTSYVGTPELQVVKGVEDQVPVLMWGAEVAGVRTGVLRNYAEDGTYTDYTVTTTRALSGENAFTLLSGTADVYFRTASEHAAATVAVVADSLILTITAETGAQATAAYRTAVYDTVRSHIAAAPMAVGRDSILTDTVRIVPDDNLDLAGITIGDEALTTFSPYTLSYLVYETAEVTVAGIAGSEQQSVTTEAHTGLSDGSDIYYIHVRAGNGATRIYTVRVMHTVPSADASLAGIRLDGEPMSGFAPTTYTYTFQLPMHSVVPDVEAVPSDDHAVVTVSRVGNIVILKVTAEDGVTEQNYTLDFQIEPSDWSTLQGILVDGEPLEDFDAETLSYEVTLPVYTLTLPEIGYIKREWVETVTIDTVQIADYQGSYTLHVTAENGINQTAYTVHFTVEKSSDAHLGFILLDGVELDGWDADTYNYTVYLPYGSALPTVNFVPGPGAQTVVMTGVGGETTIVVTAEDGVSTATYTVSVVFLPSENAQLEMIYVAGDSLPGFDPENFEYEIVLPYGVTEHPALTWTAGDEQQTVTLLPGDADTIRVVAGNGDFNEYIVAYTNALSANNYLTDLKLEGVSFAGFHRDSTTYVVIYPVGTPESALYTREDVEAVPEDPSATVAINEDANHTLSVIVTAQKGDVRPYVIRQEIALSSEARLAMIYVDSVELSGFNPDVHEYTYIIAQGRLAPEVMAETIDERAEVEYGMLTDEEGGSYIEIDGVAEDGTVLTYTIHFREANWTPSPDVTNDDYLFYYVGGGMFKAVTIGLEVSVAVFDTEGHRVAYSKVPTADPNTVTVETREDGSRKLVKAEADAEGYFFVDTKPNTTYFYTFFDVRNKHVAKGGKVKAL